MNEKTSEVAELVSRLVLDTPRKRKVFKEWKSKRGSLWSLNILIEAGVLTCRAKSKQKPVDPIKPLMESLEEQVYLLGFESCYATSGDGAKYYHHHHLPIVIQVGLEAHDKRRGYCILSSRYKMIQITTGKIQFPHPDYNLFLTQLLRCIPMGG